MFWIFDANPKEVTTDYLKPPKKKNEKKKNKASKIVYINRA
jgi:hypothetical protein